MQHSFGEPSRRVLAQPLRSRTALAGAFALALAALAPLPAAADIVYLEDGTTVEGEVTDLGDRVVVRKTSGISVTYEKWRVKRIERRASAAGDYRKQKEAVEWDDAKGLLGLARWCMKKGLKTEAERAYRDTLWIASPVYRQAKKELAGFLEKENRLKEALALYTELGPSAAERAKVVRGRLDERRADVYQKGSKLLTDGKYREALVALERAYNLTPPDPRASSPRLRRGAANCPEQEAPGGQLTTRSRSSGSAKPGVVTEADILAMLVAARGLHAESLKKARVSLSDCTACKALSTVQCSTCRGKGRVLRDVLKMTMDGMKRVRKWLTCETCRGAKIVRCSKCSGVSVDLKTVARSTRGVLRMLAERAFGNVRTSPDRAIDRMNRWLASHPLAFAGGEPSYAKSKELRGAFMAVPPSAAELKILKSAWVGAGADVRGNFLACYGLEFARLLAFVPQSARADDVRDDVAALVSAETADASLVSAFPAEHSGTALRIVGIWKGSSEGAAGAPRVDIDFEAAGPVNLRPFFWKPAAKSFHKRVGDALGFKGMSSRALAYPYGEIGRTAAERKGGDRVELLGRLYYDGTPAPDWRFEVWRVSLRPDEEMERAVALLSRRVTFRFRDTPLDAAMGMLTDLAGVPIDLDVPGGLAFTVTNRARRAPLGRALTGLLGALELYWTYADGRVKVTSRISAEDRTRVKAILKLLSPSAAHGK